MKRFFLILAIFSLVIIFGLRIKDDWFRYRMLKAEVDESKAKNASLLQEEKRLERLKEEGSKTEVLEREAREMLGLKKEGENVILILPLNNQVLSNETTTQGIILSEHFKIFIAQITRIWYNFKDFFTK
ncbi:MAG: septum formation initiator family protein [Candidatus Paceibacterota bacterium]|jgi:cell division protein FtsB